MIARIRIVGLRPGALDQHKEVARDWARLIREHGGSIVGLYVDEQSQEAIGIAEYESRERLAAIQKNCECDPAFACIRERTHGVYTSFEERILDKLECMD